jgi:ubiquinone/menaquinone biosynthesis C-methylase UbiE
MPTATLSDVESLIDRLNDSTHKTDEQWRRSLTPRKVAELEFHDQWRGDPAERRVETQSLHSNSKYYSTTSSSQAYLESWIEMNAKGKVVLDYACGDGASTIRAAKAGAALAIGLDISSVSVENARRRAAQEGVAHNTRFVQGDCENTGLPSESVDVVICCGMLHHLDLSYAFPELRRILKTGGKCLAYEALDYNPAIKLYRLLTPSKRTEWEKHHILSLKDLRFARKFFDVRNVKYWHLTSILTTPLRNTPLFRPSLTIANRLDSLLLKVFPLSLLAWIFTFELCKRADS